MIKEIVKVASGIMETRRMRVQRKPVEMDCQCGHKVVLVLPDGDGHMLWECKKCPRRHRADFRGEAISFAIGI